ncbi:MAG TPA: formate dehydrogenase subunit gamma [Paracoccaceae bacterium]|nr:formate dehydrogenase subunit gamma [Paracoccaceae bacterium]HMO70376.1 formate dehydrogenase subunit gamma [Paracoccaceae bacterium]
MKHVLSALAFALALTLAAPAMVQAQQVNPTANSVTEDALFNALRPGQEVAGRISIPDAGAAGLIKPDNKGWAATHNTTVKSLTTWSIAGVLVLLALFYVVRGRIRIDAGPSGRSITRFAGIERFAHWLMAGSFIVLALTGLNLVLGRTLVLPLVGEGGFGTLSAYGKIAHNYVGWAFMIGLALSFVLWVGRNIPRAHDMTWIAQGGGLLKKGVHPPAGKFNAGQKLIFWLVTLGGIALSVTGYFLLFPGTIGQADWQFYQLIHGIVSALLTAIILAHIYIGSVGMEGAFDAMGSGEVDLNWAKEHHPLWVEEVQGKGAAHGSAHPAE